MDHNDICCYSTLSSPCVTVNLTELYQHFFLFIFFSFVQSEARRPIMDVFMKPNNLTAQQTV